MDDSFLYSIISVASASFVSGLGILCKYISTKLDDKKYKSVKLALERVEKCSDSVREGYGQNIEALVERMKEVLNKFPTKQEESIPS